MNLNTTRDIMGLVSQVEILIKVDRTFGLIRNPLAK